MGRGRLSMSVLKGKFASAVKFAPIPLAAVSAIYARENGQGLSFEIAPFTAPAPTVESGSFDGPPPEPPRPSGKPSLRRVK